MISLFAHHLEAQHLLASVLFFGVGVWIGRLVDARLTTEKPIGGIGK